MRKLYYYDNVHQRRRKQQQLIDCNNYCRRSDIFGDNGKHRRRFRGIGAILSKYVAIKNNEYKHDENLHLHRRHIDCNEQRKQQQKQFTQLTKCAKMSEENGMIKNGNLNGVGIARSLSQNLTNFSNFTISPSTAITSPLPPLPPPTTTTTATASTSASTSSTTGTSLANSISNSSNSVRANNESTSTATSPANAHNGGGGGGGGGGGDTSNSDFGDQKPTNNNNSNVGAHPPSALGGRLQIFKDGKFILELACSKEGERGGWVSVPRKTYWPPAAPSSNNNSMNHNKNESSTSLSFSDDNSSIQSSPWQRDHCWKQPSPRRNISRELCLFYCRPAAIVLHAKCLRISKLKSRRPHDTKMSANQRVEYVRRTISTASKSPKIDEIKAKTTIVTDAVKKEEEPTIDVVDSGESSGKVSENVDEKKSTSTTMTRRTSSDENEMTVDVENNIRTKPTRLMRPKLNDILQKLIDKLAEQPQNVVGMQTGPGASALLSSGGGGNGTSRTSDLSYYQQHVSPRKRILREFEKVSLEEAANTSTSTKRSRSKGGINSSASLDASRTANGNRNANVLVDGTPKVTQSSTLYPIGQANVTPAASRPISSYSITSLLGHNSSSSTSNSTVKLDNGQRMSPKSPQQPSTARMPKKKSPINGSSSIGSPLGLTSSSFGSHRSPMNSPINYGGRSTRSPDVNSPSPDHLHSMRNHAQRYAFMSSPTSGFHPYLPTSRASPLSGGADATLHPSCSRSILDLHPSCTRAGPELQPAQPLPTAASTPISQIAVFVHATNSNSVNHHRVSQDQSPPPPLRTNKSSAADYPPSPPALPLPTRRPSPWSSNKQQDWRSNQQELRSNKQNGAAISNPVNRSSHPNTASGQFQPFQHSAESVPTVPAWQRIRSDTPPIPFHPFQAFQHGGVAIPPTSAMAAAAYLNPLYYHPMTYSNPFRPQFWMPYPPAHPAHPEMEWNGEKRRATENTSIECRRGTAGEYDSFQSIREEQNSDVPLNLSKH